MRRHIQVVCLAFLVSGISFPAYAYVDPGMGTMLIQILIGSSIGFMFYFCKVRNTIKSFLGIGDSKSGSNDKQDEINAGKKS